MGDGMGEVRLLEELLKIENVIAKGDDLRVLRFGQAPDEQMNLARVLRKIGRNLLAYECVGQIRNAETALDRVVIGQGDEIHSRALAAGDAAPADRSNCQENRTAERATLPIDRCSANGYGGRTCSYDPKPPPGVAVRRSSLDKSSGCGSLSLHLGIVRSVSRSREIRNRGDECSAA